MTKQLPFKDVSGKTRMILPVSVTMDEMVRCGIHIQVVPKGQPQLPHEFKADPDDEIDSTGDGTEQA